MRTFIDRLRRHTPLEHEVELALLSLQCTPLKVQANADCATPGTSSQLFLVAAGMAGRFEQVSDGRRQITGLYLPGEVFNLHCLSGRAAHQGLQALPTTTVLRLSAAELHPLIRRFPSLANALWNECSADAARSAAWIVNVGRRDAQTRLAHLLCELALRMEDAGLGTRREFILDATQTQIGDALGLTSVHVNRTIKALRTLGLISVSGRLIRILDWNALSGAGDFADSYLRTGTDIS